MHQDQMVRGMAHVWVASDSGVNSAGTIMTIIECAALVSLLFFYYLMIFRSIVCIWAVGEEKRSFSCAGKIFHRMGSTLATSSWGERFVVLVIGLFENDIVDKGYCWLAST